MTAILDFSEDKTPLRFVYWYEFAAFTLAITLSFFALTYLFQHFG